MSEVTLKFNHNTDRLMAALEGLTAVRRGFNRIYKLDDKNKVELDVRNGVADLISITQNGTTTNFSAVREHDEWALKNVGVVTGLAKFHCCNRVHIGKSVFHVPEVVQVERVQVVTHSGAHHSHHVRTDEPLLKPDELESFILAAILASALRR
jgi:hypothetical protein